MRIVEKRWIAIFLTMLLKITMVLFMHEQASLYAAHL